MALESYYAETLSIAPPRPNALNSKERFRDWTEKPSKGLGPVRSSLILIFLPVLLRTPVTNINKGILHVTSVFYCRAGHFGTW